MLIWKMKERRLDQARKFLCISFWSFHMHPIVLVYNSARIDHSIELKSAPKFFYTFFTCLKLASVMSFMFRLLQNPFPSGKEVSSSLSQLLISINTFPPYETEFINVSMKVSMCVLELFCRTFIKLYFIVFFEV